MRPKEVALAGWIFILLSAAAIVLTFASQEQFGDPAGASAGDLGVGAAGHLHARSDTSSNKVGSPPPPVGRQHHRHHRQRHHHHRRSSPVPLRPHQHAKTAAEPPNEIADQDEGILSSSFSTTVSPPVRLDMRGSMIEDDLEEDYEWEEGLLPFLGMNHQGENKII